MRSLSVFLSMLLLTGIQGLLAQEAITDKRTSKSDEPKISVTEGYQTIKTYPFSDPNPLPAMAISKMVSSFYPYFMIDGYTNQGLNKNWKVVTLENEFITVTVLPEVGGKVWGAIEKSTGKEFVYMNHAMKFRSIAIRGPWTSGGIEHNFGLDLGHAPWAASPVDYILTNNPVFFIKGFTLAHNLFQKVMIHHFLVVRVYDTNPARNATVIVPANAKYLIKNFGRLPLSFYEIGFIGANRCGFLRFFEEKLSFLQCFFNFPTFGNVCINPLVT